jgi:L-glyceraldehyde 3-phosphate reductase
MGALEQVVRQGKALYVGISSYNSQMTKEATAILKRLGIRCLIHQPYYNMFDRWIEKDLLDVLEKEGMGCIAFCPLAQGLLTDRYLHGIPADSRAGRPTGYLRPAGITKEKLKKVAALQKIAKKRNQSLAQMALAWTLRDSRVTSALIGASKVQQIEDNVAALKKLNFTKEELAAIEKIIA